MFPMPFALDCHRYDFKSFGPNLVDCLLHQEWLLHKLPVVKYTQQLVLAMSVQGYGLDDRGFESRQGLGIFLFTTAFSGYEELFPWR